MPKRYHINAEQVLELEKARRKNKDKNIENRLEALLLHADGKKREETAKKTGFAVSYISELVSKYFNYGIEAIVENHYGGNHRNLSFDDEAILLEPFMKRAEAGQIVEVSEIKQAYEEKLGRNLEKDHGIIYRVLEWHNWRKVMPRSKHPNKASDETIEVSKKLTHESMN